MGQNAKDLISVAGLAMGPTGLLINSAEAYRESLAQGLSYNESMAVGLTYGALATAVEMIVSPGLERSIIGAAEKSDRTVMRKMINDVLDNPGLLNKTEYRWLKGLTNTQIEALSKELNPVRAITGTVLSRGVYESIEEGLQFSFQKMTESLYNMLDRETKFKSTDWTSPEFLTELW